MGIVLYLLDVARLWRGSFTITRTYDVRTASNRSIEREPRRGPPAKRNNDVEKWPQKKSRESDDQSE